MSLRIVDRTLFLSVGFVVLCLDRTDSAHQDKLSPDDPRNEWVVDIGVYGEPTVSSFRHRRVLRELQSFVDAPSSWGVNYEKPEVVYVCMSLCVCLSGVCMQLRGYGGG